MSTHSGVSCDACTKKNFPERRYKCLLCDNYDLCGPCYDANAESQNHKSDHPMQCILTETAAELFYSGEFIPRRSIVSLTCPHCGLSGFIPQTLLTHSVEKHPSTSSQNKNTQAVLCPICVTSPAYGSRSRYVLLTDHIIAAHDDTNGGGGSSSIGLFNEDDFPLGWNSAPPQRRQNEDDSDDDEDEEDDETTENDIEHRAFVQEEHRRQEAARQRFAQASSLVASINPSTHPQRRPFTRQAPMRGYRDGSRGHFNRYPYGTSPRTNVLLGSNNSQRSSLDPSSSGSPTQTPSANDQNSSSIFAQDPMLDIVSRLASSSSGISTANVSASEFLRLQQQVENAESMAQIKSTLLNAKQKRSSHLQQQQSTTSSTSSTPQPVILNYSPFHDYQFWQQHLSTLQAPIGFLTGIHPSDLPATSHVNNNFSKNSQHSNREFEPRSLIGKMLRNEPVVNNNAKNDDLMQKQQDHLSFLQAILISTMLTNLNDDQNNNQLT